MAIASGVPDMVEIAAAAAAAAVVVVVAAAAAAETHVVAASTRRGNRVASFRLQAFDCPPSISHHFDLEEQES
jgi:hypothetical protein